MNDSINKSDKRIKCPKCGKLHGWHGNAYYADTCEWPAIPFGVMKGKDNGR